MLFETADELLFVLFDAEFIFNGDFDLSIFGSVRMLFLLLLFIIFKFLSEFSLFINITLLLLLFGKFAVLLFSLC